MLCWICPDCGRDCSPAARECPYCAQQQVSVTTAVLSIVEQLREVPTVPLLAPAPQQYLLFGLTNGEPAGEGSTTVLVDEPPVPGSDTAEAIESCVRPLVESAEPAPPPSPQADPAPSTALRREIAPIAAKKPVDLQPKSNGPAQFQPSVAKSIKLVSPTAPCARIAAAIDGINLKPLRPSADPVKPVLLIPASFPAPIAKSIELSNPARPAAAASSSMDAKSSAAEPLPPMAARVTVQTIFHPVQSPMAAVPVETAALPATGPESPVKPAPHIAARAAFHLRTAAALESAQPAITRRPIPSANLACDALAANPDVPALPRFHAILDPLAAAVELAQTARAVCDAIELRALELVAAIQTQIEAYEAEIGAIVSTFHVQPALALLPAAGEIVTAPAPPDLQWKKTARPRIPGCKPKHFHYGALVQPAQKIPLAGPCLPAELRGFIEPDMPEYPRRGTASGIPTWAISLILATALFLAGRMFLQNLTQNHDGSSPAVAQAASQTAAPTSQAAPFEAHPFARFVEVTGLRVVADLNHRSQVQYIVVNHSSAQLTGMLIRIAVRSSQDSPNAPPLFTVSAVIPSLAPHQSKEIRTDLDSELRASAIPDWEYLRTDVQVGTQN